MGAAAQGSVDRRSEAMRPTCTALRVPILVLMRTFRRLAIVAVLTSNHNASDNPPAPITPNMLFRYRSTDARSGMIKSPGAPWWSRSWIRTLLSRSGLRNTRSPVSASSIGCRLLATPRYLATPV